MGFETGAELLRKWICQHFLLGRKGGGGNILWEQLSGRIFSLRKTEDILPDDYH